ncbi:MAG: hypothetical protein ACT4N2_11900 [Hyphomicrobium sp.]
MTSSTAMPPVRPVVSTSRRTQSAASRSLAASTPLPILVVILSLICPTEFSVDVAGLRFPPHRFAFILFLPLALYRLATRSDTRLQSFDILIAALAVWQTAIFASHAGQEGFVYGGSLALETIGGYAIARAYIRDVETLIVSLRTLVLAIGLVAGIALLDTLTRSFFTHEVLRGLIGGPPMPPADIRWGLARAAATFDHPIHYGTFCAAMFALLWCAERDAVRRRVQAAVVAFATLLALSSAPLLSLGLQFAMLTWERFTRGFALRTHLTLAILAGLYIGMAFVSSRPPIQLLITGMTFDPWTGLYRMLIWEHGLANVWESPWTGLGLAEWERPSWMVSSTIDAYWLVLPMRSGIPAFLILAAAILLLGRAVVKRGIGSPDRERRRLSAGWMISLIALCLLGATVHYWNVPHALLFFFLGLGGVLADPKRMKARVVGPAPVKPRRPAYGQSALPLPA